MDNRNDCMTGLEPQAEFLTPLESVLAAIGTDNDYRTLGGIARDARLLRSDVKRIIDEHQDLFEVGQMTIGGETVYKLRKQCHSVPA